MPRVSLAIRLLRKLAPATKLLGPRARRRSRTPTTAPARQHDRGDNAESDDNSSGHEIEIHTLKPAHAGRHDRSHGQKTRSNGKSENGCHLEGNPGQPRSHAHVHRRRGKRADPSTPHRQSASLQLRIGSASTGARVSSRTGVGSGRKRIQRAIGHRKRRRLHLTACFNGEKIRPLAFTVGLRLSLTVASCR
jgi:hypothetical protein